MQKQEQKNADIQLATEVVELLGDGASMIMPVGGLAEFMVNADVGNVDGAIAALPMVALDAATGRKGNTAKTAGKEGIRTLFKFSKKATSRMEDPDRFVPVQILDEAIKGDKVGNDSKGSRAIMHNIKMSKNGETYNLEVLHDKETNTIWHFKYSTPKK